MNEDLFKICAEDEKHIKTKDIAWCLARLDLSELDENRVSPICITQDIPSWSGFNSLITDEDLPVKKLGFYLLYLIQ